MQNTGRINTRHVGNTGLIVLLSLILFTLIVLVIVVVAGRRDTDDHGRPTADPHGAGNTPAVGDGQTVRRTELGNVPKSPKPIGDPNRIKDTLQAGKTYRVVVKGGFDARVEDKDWGIKEVISLGYAVEMAVRRKIESNDGHRIVELRTFETCRNVKILSKVESVSIELGLPGTLLLGAVAELNPGAAEAVVQIKSVAESVLKGGAQSLADDAAAKAFARVETISGKTVRITYVDGVGVNDITPIDCSLDADERDWVFDTATLSDCYILPDIKLAAGATWTVDRAQFAGFVDPSLPRSRPGKSLSSERTMCRQARSKLRSWASNADTWTWTIQIRPRSVSGVSRLRGTMRYNLTDGYVEQSELSGDLRIETVSKNHILFEARFRTEPKMHLKLLLSNAVGQWQTLSAKVRRNS